MDDTQALLQAFIENIQREDLTPLDKARALKELVDETGWSYREIARRGIMGEGYVSRLLALLEEPEPIQQKLASDAQRITERHVRAARESGLGPITRVGIIEKAAKEGLTTAQTRRIAESVAAAKTGKRRQFLLEVEYNPDIHDAKQVKRRQERYGDHDPLLRVRNLSEAQQWSELPTIKEIRNTTKMWRRELAEFREATSLDKLAPEAKQFLAHRLEPFAEEFTAWIEELREGAPHHA